MSHGRARGDHQLALCERLDLGPASAGRRPERTGTHNHQFALEHGFSWRNVTRAVMRDLAAPVVDGQSTRVSRICTRS